MKQEKSPYGFDNSLAKAARKRREREQEEGRPSRMSGIRRHRAGHSRPLYLGDRAHQDLNQHWFEEKRPSPYEPFPCRKNRPDLEAIFALLASKNGLVKEKPRHRWSPGVASRISP